MSKHAVVWLDQKEARVFNLHSDHVDEAHLRAPSHLHHKHPTGAEGAKDHPDDAKRFFQQIARSLDGSEEILVVGPAKAKLELIRYLHAHEHALEAKVIGVETVDHPTDGQLVAYARTYFVAADRMKGT